MKTLSITNTVLACALGLGAFASAPVFAQSQAVAVNVPFDFQIGAKTMPAGIYRIDMPNQHVILLRGSAHDANRFASTIPEISTTPRYSGKVVFHRYGNRYFLHEVWTAGSDTGRECLPTKEEKAMQVAQNPSVSDGTEVALNLLPQ